MPSFDNVYPPLYKRLLYKSAVLGIKHLPIFAQKAFAIAGYPNFVTRSGIKYRGRIFGTNYRIDADSRYIIEVYATSKNYRLEAFEGIKHLNLQGAVIFDIGANVGTYSIGMASLGAKKIFAIEPGLFFSKLLKNITTNNLNSIISPYQLGFGDKEGSLLWFEDRENPGNAHVLSSKDELITDKIPAQLIGEGTRVPITTFDKFAADNQISQIDLIKIDVEGMEWDVLSNAKSIIEKYKPIIVAETNRISSDMRGFDCITPMFSYFYGRGYKTYTHLNNSLFSHRKDTTLSEFIYPNFTQDTFFIHPENSRFSL